VYLAAFRQNLNVETTAPDEPISVRMGADRPVKWIANYDKQFKGPMPIRQALAESRNAEAVWITREIGRSAPLARWASAHRLRPT
jgi:membrane carboxypeptidase/penicillin-binding protein